MGCGSSNLLNNEDDFPQLGSSVLGHHIVSLTSSTYGLLNLDPPSTPPPPPPSSTTPTITTPPLLWSHRHQEAEVINSWDLMSGLDTESFRFSPVISGKDGNFIVSKENSNPNFIPTGCHFQHRVLKSLQDPSFGNSTSGFGGFKMFKDASFIDDTGGFPGFDVSKPLKDASFSDNARGCVESKSLKEEGGVCFSEKFEGFKDLCPPNGENKVVIYTTSLRGIRKTFEDCNVVRSALETFGVAICERDVSMDRGFREELRDLMVRGKEKEEMVLPRVFVKGKYVGGVKEAMRIVDEGWMGELLKGLPKKRAGELCEGCGDARFLPCFTCNGSCKMVVMGKEEEGFGCKDLVKNEAVVRCPDCNENGLVLCPICS